MKILVTGSRHWTDKEAIKKTLLELTGDGWAPFTLVHGDCYTDVNADKLAGEIAVELGWKVVACPVDFRWDGPWPMAGHRRNTRMLKENHTTENPIDLCIAFPGPTSSGTWDMVSKCAREKIPRWIYPTGWQED